MKPTNQAGNIQRSRGFTLVELTIAMLIGLMIATITLALFNQQLSTFAILRTQNFMVREAPQVNLILNKLIPQADSLLIYSTDSDINGGNPIFATRSKPGTAVALRFTKANLASASESELDKSFGVISFDSGAKKLNYYANLSSLSQFDTTKPSWTISSQVENAVFFFENGVLRIRLTGPEGGEITYSASAL